MHLLISRCYEVTVMLYRVHFDLRVHLTFTQRHGCYADVFRRTDGRLDDGRGGVRDLDAL
jgi:hypothetical protein